MTPDQFRWPLADRDGPPALFDVDDLVGPERGTGRLSGLEFLHVAAKRVINPVPPQSRMPFRWTINVYRGCSHACVYCLDGDTLILLADGTTKPLRDLRRFEPIVGTQAHGTYRTYTTAYVLEHWRTEKRAYRVSLADGTTLVASGDHRFLTSAGWRRVLRLDVGDQLLGIGALAAPPAYAGRGPGSVTTLPVRRSARQAAMVGAAVRGWDGLRVVEVTDLAVTVPMYDITTTTGNFIANGVVSHNCFARPTHEYLGLNTGEDFDRRIVVKVNAVEKVRAELADPKWQGDHVAMGTNTDPYQRCEGKYRLTRGVVEALTERANPFSILTKSALVTRDLDLLTEANRRTDVSVSFSVGTLDEDVWRATEPGTPHPRRRLDAMRQMAEAGIRTGALIAPVLPGLSDRPEQLQEVVRAVRDAGGTISGPLPLHLRPGVREHVLGWLESFDPVLYADYLQRYAGRAYAPKPYVEAIRLAAFRNPDAAPSVGGHRSSGRRSL